jgi:hypothetical protein
MITPIDRSQLHLVRGSTAANAGHVPPRPFPKPQATLSTLARGPLPAPEPDSRSPLARNVETLVLDAYEAGRQHGERQNYTAGWRFGLLCGLLPGMLSGAGIAALIILWLA